MTNTVDGRSFIVVVVVVVILKNRSDRC